MANRTKADSETTRETLLNVSGELFADVGYTATSIDEICARAGTTKGALFHHFKNKQALFEEAWTRLQMNLDEDAREEAIAARSLTDPYAAFLAGCRTYLNYVARPDYQQIVLVDGPAILGTAGWYERDNDLGAENVAAGLRYLSKKGIIASHRVPTLTVMVQSALNGSGFALTRNAPGITPESIMETFEALVRQLR